MTATTSTTTSTTLLNDVDIEVVGGLIQAVSADPTKGATRWRASVTWLGGFRSEAKVRSFAPIASDEPAALGGTDTARDLGNRAGGLPFSVQFDAQGRVAHRKLGKLDEADLQRWNPSA